MKVLVLLQRLGCCLSIGSGLCFSQMLLADVDVDVPSNTTTVSGNESSPVTSYQADGTVIYEAGTQHVTSSGTNATFTFNYGGNTITLQPGALLQSTGQYGLWISNAGDDNINTLYNAGTISATSPIGHAIYEHTDSTGSDIYNYTVVDDVITPGTITGQLTGIVKNGTGSVYNYGTIQGVQDNGIAFSAANSSLYNYANDDFTGTIIGQQTGVVVLQTPTAMINQGIITGTTQHGMYFQVEGQVTNTGTITGNSAGILFNDQNGTVINDGNINGNYGVYFYDATGSLTNNANGVITANDYGVYIDDNDGYVLNYGTIRATGDGSHAIDADGTSQIQNYGILEGLSSAIYAYGQTTMINGENATITSLGSGAIWMSNGGSLENRGTITGNAANYLGNAAIQGIDTLFNYGTVDGSSNGVAIRCTDGDDDIYLYTGSEVYGSIEGQSEDATGDRIYFRDSDSSQYGNLRNNVYGFETATKQDAGTWTIRDTVTSFGVQTFDVDYGILVNDGIITVSDAFNINQGGMLNGRGTINGAGSVNVKEDGILAPNRSSYLDHISVSDQPRAQMSTIGTKTINTQLNLEAGSFLEIEVQGSEIDKVVANSVNIQGNLVIVPLVNAAEISDEELVFLESTALIDTQFASVDVHNIETDTITFDVIYYDNSVAIQKSVAAFEDKALTPNQKHIGRVLDNLPGGMGDLRNQMNLVGNGQLQKEMDRLRPNGAPIRTVFSNAQGFSQDSLQLARSVQQGNTRFAAAPGQSMLKQLHDDPYNLAQDSEQTTEQTISSDGKLHFFASPFGQFGDIDSSDSRTGYSYDAYGAIIGLDYNCIPNMSLGLSLGYINTDIGLDNSAGDSKVDTLRFGPYLTYTNGNWNVDASITGGFHWIDANRNTIMGTAESDYNSYDFTIYGATSYDMQLDKVTLSPTFSLTYVHQMTDDYAESGAGSANLTVEDMQTDSLQSLIGVHASMPVMIGNLALTPEAWIGWKYEWLDRDVDINSAFSANVTSPFTTTSQGTSRSQLVAGAAVFSQINEMTSIKLNYELNTASDVTIHSVWAMIELNF